MMFKYKAIFNKVGNFTILNRVLFGIAQDEKVVRYDFTKSKVDSIKNVFKINYFFPYLNTIIGLKINGEAIQFDEKMNFLPSISDVQLTRLKFQTPNIVGYRGNIFERKYGVYSLDSYMFLWSRKDIKSLEQIEDNFIGQWQFALTKYNRESGEIEWVHDFSVAWPQLKDQNGRINLIGISNNILVLGIKKIDRIFGIDINTGKILWEVKTIALGLKIGHGGIIHQMLVNYNCFDILTGEKIKSFVDRDYFEKVGIETQRDNFVVIGDHIITTDSRKGKIGAFNTNTGRFDWVYEVEGVSFPGGREIVYSAPYLFVHDSNGDLHVFEK